jgi:myo-inositol-1(or 4)-monophosphatase
MPTLDDLKALAAGAGEILRAGYQAAAHGHRSQVFMKGEIDLVTETDRQSEAYVIGEIRRQFPTHSIVAEESGNAPGDPERVWYIDPLDGTVNFAHGLPIFAVSIAYAENGRTRLGVVYDPIHEECYSAERGAGAWLNGAPIHISNASELGSSLLVTGFPYDIRTNRRNNLDLYAEFSLCSRGVRRLGSAALDLCYLAAGRLDGFWEISIQQYDVAAGGLVAEEAGAVVTALDGVSDYLVKPPSILASTPQVHPQMAAVIRRMHSTES